MTYRNYNDPAYKRWRKLVYIRDGFQCQWPKCNNRKKLHAHHIKTWSNYPSLRFVVSNGITLCRNHHDMIKGNEDAWIRLFYTIISKKQII